MPSVNCFFLLVSIFFLSGNIVSIIDACMVEAHIKWGDFLNI